MSALAKYIFRRAGRFIPAAIACLTAAAPSLAQDAVSVDILPTEDSVYVFSFIPRIQMFKTQYEDNGQVLASIRERLRDFDCERDTIYVYGFSGDWLSDCNNRNTADWRTVNLKRYLRNTSFLKEENFKTEIYPSVHGRFGEAVVLRFSEKRGLPNRGYVSEQSDLNVAAERIVPQVPLSSVGSAGGKGGARLLSAALPDLSGALYGPKSHSLEPVRKNAFLALKTNLLFDALLMPNFEIEVPLGDRWSVQGEYMFPWWVSKDDTRALQILSGGVEGRYWFGHRNRMERLAGHFLGLYAGGGMYDVEYRGAGYQGEFYIASGISYGYGLRLSSDFRMEFSLGVGFLGTSYSRYNLKDNHLVWQNDGRYTWIGPTKLKISLVWVLNRKEKGGRR